MVLYWISEFEFLEFLLNPRYSWVLWVIKRSFGKLLGKLVFQCDCEVTMAVKKLKKYPFLLLNQAQSNFFCTSLYDRWKCLLSHIMVNLRGVRNKIRFYYNQGFSTCFSTGTLDQFIEQKYSHLWTQRQCIDNVE